MSKALPVVLAAIIIGGALTPIYLANQATPGQQAKSGQTTAATSNIQKISYALGYQVSSQTPPDMDSELFAEGMRDGQAKKTPRFTEQEINQALMAYQQDMQKQQQQQLQQEQQQQQASAQSSVQAGDVFLATNAKKPGVVTTASGLQYLVIKEGTGATPTASSEVKVDYEGKLIDGTVFDSSIKRGEPLAFGLSQVIPGWTEGLQLMKEGAHYRFFIPAKLGYGEAGAGEAIPPNSTLIFDVILIKVNP
ncbi:peptidylprolyl isomerase [Alkanindiges hydrocarboniclasticus]|uniref:Peptidyl-prolyl cis-trans isomerase n=1 Tax=Alkanindiges hydrocarboniclasticus TaxID=1907941 RepID=A0A1S8CUW7_9GAMM|nr:FKBP-type peptidyl-prolyl cis-trans isomerase [Alkanindiges hydrocarboniclasticus]ONG41031.1 peptidylprolyl isomerase [Alkanindiges hydrocarboniclasticus]